MQPVANRMLEEEEQLLAEVRSTVAAARRLPVCPDYDGELIKLRDAVAEEKLSDDQAMYLDQMNRMAAISKARVRRLPEKVDVNSPYFAHLGLLTEQGQRRDILLGKRTFIRDNVRIVDWRDAPISKVFYHYSEGDAFSEEIAHRQLSGEVTKRRTVTIVSGRLVRVASPQGTYLRVPGGWREVSGKAVALQGGSGRATRPDTAALVLGSLDTERVHRADKRLPEIAALLDREQFDLLTRQGDTHLVVSGGAGSGKTTVGLHRLAYLVFQDSSQYRPRRMQVVVFSLALARYISRVLPALGVEDVPVTTLGKWAMVQRRRHFPGLTHKVCPLTPTSVVRFKTHRALIPMLKEAARAVADGDPVALFDELFTDHGWISQGIRRFAPGVFTQAEIEEIHRWCTDQQFRRFDGPEPQDEADLPCYDEEDAMILLCLHQLVRGRLMYARKRRLFYDHLMIDEAQDFSPLELMVLHQTVPSGSVTLAGDASQKITDNDFSSWSELLKAIGQEHFEVSTLKVSYRSTRQIMELAQAVLGPLVPEGRLDTVRSGEPVESLRFGGQGEAMTFLSESLADLLQREPSASVAVLTRTGQQADEAYSALGRIGLDHISRVSDQDFSFGPGIEVTDVASTKGLEFDYVILLHVDAENYPDTPAARHLLHIGSTRAIHQLWLMSWGQPCPLLPEWIKPRMGG